MREGDHWYKNSVIYAVDVEYFYDADGDGVGDIGGLTDRLDYLSRLGVDCLWVLPFFPTTARDNGYDVIDYYGVDDRFGDLGAFAEFLNEAESRGFRVIIDLIVNHTSDRHPWFQKAREDPDSKYRDYYVWTDDPESATVDAETIFPGQEEGVWTYDEVADAYYFHRFYDFEPGLNIANPDVREEIRDIMGYWLRLGVDGFRLDAASHMIEPKGFEHVKPDDPHGVLRDLRQFVTTRKGDAVLIGEVDEEPDDLGEFFGDGEELTMLFNFLLDNYLFLGLARESAEPVVEGMRLLPSTPCEGQWVNFLRNLDELDLERLTESERDDVFEAFAPEEDMRIFGRGVRRRLAPMLDGVSGSSAELRSAGRSSGLRPREDDATGGTSDSSDDVSGNDTTGGAPGASDRDERRLRLAFSLLFSLPGTPMLVYGDEIGMGDDLSLHGRSAVRTPMQWSSEKNAGFSDAHPDELAAPVIDEGAFSYDRVNVRDQEFDPNSMFNWMQRLVNVRRENPEFGWGEFELVETSEPSVLAHRCAREEGNVMAIHNLAGEAVPVSLSPSDVASAVDLFANRRYDPLDGDAFEFTVDPYGYRWLRLRDGE